MSEQQPGSLAALSADAAPEPALGQIWIARSDRGHEVRVLIIEVHDQYVQALLCGDECDWATGTDAVLSPILTETDPRWEWKLEQHKRLRAVRASARELGLGIYELGPREE